LAETAHGAGFISMVIPPEVLLSLRRVFAILGLFFVLFVSLITDLPGLAQFLETEI
jgi:hypothetical protein